MFDCLWIVGNMPSANITIGISFALKILLQVEWVFQLTCLLLPLSYYIAHGEILSGGGLMLDNHPYPYR